MVLDSGDTAWMLVAGSLVLLMIPALGLFESGLLRNKLGYKSIHPEGNSGGESFG